MGQYKFGLSAEFPCGYLRDQQERLLIFADDEPLTPEIYAQLQHNGFRRSEEIAYRPYCAQCNACQSIRVLAHEFTPSRSHKRIQNKCQNFKIVIATEPKESYYPLFERYINERHSDGVMFPAQPSQLDSFTNCSWVSSYFIEVYAGKKLIAVAVGDQTEYALSAVYSFFDPDYAHFSLGVYLILEQIKLTIVFRKPWLYLGYYIKDCNKMNYKNRFKPFEIRQNDEWIRYG